MNYEISWKIIIIDRYSNKKEEIVNAKNSKEAKTKFFHKHNFFHKKNEIKSFEIEKL